MTRRRGEEGVALILVLVFVVLLGAIVVEYTYETQVDASLAMAHHADFEAYVAAKSAVAKGMALLEADLQGLDLAGPQDPRAQQVDPEAREYDCLTDVWAEGIPHEAINDAVMRCSIRDEGGKLNLNSLIVDGSGTDPVVESALRNLFAAFDLEEDPTDAIADWLDEDDDTRPEGAETGDYSSLETPYVCKNGPMASIQELLLVRGITPELFFDCNREQSETDLIVEEGGHPVSLSDLLTAYINPLDPEPRVNVNTAEPELLEAVLGSIESGNVAAVETIMETRLDDPFVSVADLRSRGVAAKQRKGKNPRAGSGILDVKSDMFLIRGDGRSGDTMVRIEAFVWRMPLDARGNEAYKILDWRVIQ